MLESAIGLYPRGTMSETESSGTLAAARSVTRAGASAANATRCLRPRRPPGRAVGLLDAAGRGAGAARGAAAGAGASTSRTEASRLCSLERAQPRDVLEMLIVGFGERMSAGAVGHEKQLLGARRIGRGLDRGAARDWRSAPAAGRR